MQIYITDKSGNRMWNTNVAAGNAQGERNNQVMRLARIKAGLSGFGFVDAQSARIVEECDEIEMSDDELLSALSEA
jgi:hypothetical protein